MPKTNRNQFIEDNMKLVYGAVHKYFPTLANDEDIIQIGMLGLCLAADSWDETSSKFSTYAYVCIRNEILKELRNRTKHQGVLSLSQQVSELEGCEVELGDILAADDDVELSEHDITLFRGQLSPLDEKILELRLEGLSGRDIAKILGYSHEYMYQRIRYMKNLWRKYNGDFD